MQPNWKNQQPPGQRLDPQMNRDQPGGHRQLLDNSLTWPIQASLALLRASSQLGSTCSDMDPASGQYLHQKKQCQQLLALSLVTKKTPLPPPSTCTWGLPHVGCWQHLKTSFGLSFGATPVVPRSFTQLCTRD